jgi:hypothetical protein
MCAERGPQPTSRAGVDSLNSEGGEDDSAAADRRPERSVRRVDQGLSCLARLWPFRWVPTNRF